MQRSRRNHRSRHSHRRRRLSHVLRRKDSRAEGTLPPLTRRKPGRRVLARRRAAWHATNLTPSIGHHGEGRLSFRIQ